MKKKMIWMLSALVLCVLVGCSEVQGTGSKEDPYRLTIAQLKANPEQYDMQWVEFDAYLYCERTDWACTEEIHYQLRTATLLQENAEEDTKNRDKIAMVLTEYDEDYEEMKGLSEKRKEPVQAPFFIYAIIYKEAHFLYDLGDSL